MTGLPLSRMSCLCRNLVVVLALLGLAAPAQAQVLKKFRDWTVTCTGTNLCSAHTDAAARTDALPYQMGLTLQRGPAPDAGWEISLTLNNTIPARGTPFIFQVDAGAYFKFPPRAGYTITRDRSMIDIVDVQQGSELVERLAEGRQLYVTFLDSRQRETGGGIALAGVGEAMRWIDRHQNRIGFSGGAGKPPARRVIRDAAGGSGEPPAPQEIGWEAVPKTILTQHVVNDCDQPGSRLLSVLKPERYAITGKIQLFILPCQLGAYNAVHRLYLLHDDGNPWVEPLFFAEYWRDFGWRGTDRLINVQYDPKTKRLSMFSKSRGLGDCGATAEYVWSDYAFKLLEYRYWHDCDGTRMPEQWPVIYKAVN